ncbi:hypothetical protein [Jhaorihella thermophila]|uniref:Uncharacterized protein n=1 Tax=Jhaorihella thermophila TaxID=488547 RepID=A0A1H5RPW8_9RHOB|nr:hypothetical protein [Jhaorihella thermophila]SEF39551.1 hypothetical protein SAMN05421751_10141 [Jhaorihella thermophila]
MTALTRYQRIEASGLWRPTPEDQRREVIVSIGDATLTISDMNDRALSHWSLAAIQRANPDELPAIFHPDGDPGETLELDERESEMIEAIEYLRHAVERTRPHPGRLRGGLVLLVMAVFIALMVFWLPGAMRRHAVNVVPQIQRQEIGQAILSRIGRVAGPPCRTPESEAVLDRLARRIGVARLVVLRDGVADSLLLPGGIAVVNRKLVEDYEDPSVMAGYVLVERARAGLQDPLDAMLKNLGIGATVRLLTTGALSPEMLVSHAEDLLARPRPAPPPEEAVLAMFARMEVSSRPYAYAVDRTGETVLGLIEADPMAGRDLEPLLPDRDWVLLQNICAG